MDARKSDHSRKYGEKDFTYQDLYKEFGVHIDNRYMYMVTKFQKFITENKISGYVQISDELLKEAVLSYFADIKRSKDFHNSDHANMQKINSYGIYWFLRFKPIQIQKLNSDELTEQELRKRGLLFLNELFAVGLLLGELGNERWLNYQPPQQHQQGYQSYDSFREMLLYTFKYRHYNAQMLELLWQSWVAALKMDLPEIKK